MPPYINEGYIYNHIIILLYYHFTIIILISMYHHNTPIIKKGQYKIRGKDFYPLFIFLPSIYFPPIIKTPDIN